MRTHAREKIATANVFNLSWSEPGCKNMVLTRFGGFILLFFKKVEKLLFVLAKISLEIKFVDILHRKGGFNYKGK